VTEGTIGKERLKRLARLDRRKVREELGLQLLSGSRLVEEGLRGGRVSEVFVREEGAEAWRSRARDVPVHVLAPEDLVRLAQVKTPQEVVAVGPLPAWDAPEALFERHDYVLVLDAVQDPGNVGALARTALALGIGGVLLLPGTADVTAPKVLRASAGALLRLDLARAEALPANSHVVVLPVVRGGTDVREIPPPERFALVLGNEAAGTTIQRHDALHVTIPMPGEVESLNVAAACAVILGRWL
jgi:TrmH family RNA methyltransferase